MALTRVGSQHHRKRMNNLESYDQRSIYIGLNVKYRCYSCSILMKLEFALQFFVKYSNIKFYEKPSFESRAVPNVHTKGGTDG